MVKLFVGNIASGVTDPELRNLFEKHGKVTECDVLGSFGFVHMETDKDAEEAISKLDKFGLRGQELNVEKSKSSGSGKRRDHDRPYGGGHGGRSDFETKQARRAGCTKLHVADVPNNCSARHLRSLFERFGRVAECDIVEDRNIAFVHIESCAADAAIKGLDGYSLRGSQLRVQISKNQQHPLQQRYNDRHGRGGGPMRGGRNGGPPMRGGGGGNFNSNFHGGPLPQQPHGGRGDMYDDFPPPAHDRVEMLELLEKRRRLEALHPYERQLVACKDVFNLPVPPPDFLRRLRDRAVVKLRLPMPQQNNQQQGNNQRGGFMGGGNGGMPPFMGGGNQPGPNQQQGGFPPMNRGEPMFNHNY